MNRITLRDKIDFLKNHKNLLPFFMAEKLEHNSELGKVLADMARREIGYSKKTSRIDILSALKIALKFNGWRIL